MNPDVSLDNDVSVASPGRVETLTTADWDFAGAAIDGSIHALHPYPAKFIPQIPRQLIEALSRPGDLVLDPFSGGATTAVEALAAARSFYGIDANPLAVLLGRTKTVVLSPQSRIACEALLASVALDSRLAQHAWRPAIPNVDKWYAPEIFDALVALRHEVIAVPDEAARDLALLIFANVAAKSSYQESETRYVSKPRVLAVDAVLAQFDKDLRRAIRLASVVRYPEGARAAFAEGDARDAGLYPEGVALAVTSPPYPNSFDYHLYHRFRLFWLGPGPMSLRAQEIGSHLKHQSEKDPAASYARDMRTVLTNVYRSLLPGGHFALVVGDGIYKGVTYETSERLAEIATQIGYGVGAVITRQLPIHRRSVTSAGRRLAQEQVLILRKPAAVTLVSPNYRLFPYEQVLADREAEALSATDPTRAAFAHAVERDGARLPTSQFYVEGSPTDDSRKKNSTYLTHGLHRYKGKFYPQLAKALINVSGLGADSRVVDPFGGSGTVALEANLLGFDALSLDCNPVAVSVAEAKTDVLHIGQAEVKTLLSRLAQAAMADGSRRSGTLTQFSPATLPELESWFPAPVLHKLDRVLRVVRSSDDDRLVNLGHVLVSDLIREVSHQDPKDLRIRRRAVGLDDAPVGEMLLAKIDSLAVRLDSYWTGARPHLPEPGRARVVLGDSASAELFSDVRANCVVSSPPYAAALPYIDTDRLSLAAVYGYSGHDRKSLETTMIGSREISVRERRSVEALLEETPGDLGLPDSTLSFLTSYLDAVRADDNAGFRRQQAPAVLTRYFQAMSLVLGNVGGHLEPGSDIWLVLGDSRSVIGGVGWQIPTVDEVYAIGKHRGLEMVETIPITVTREDVVHSRNTIVKNKILHLRTQGRCQDQP